MHPNAYNVIITTNSTHPHLPHNIIPTMPEELAQLSLFTECLKTTIWITSATIAAWTLRQ